MARKYEVCVVEDNLGDQLLIREGFARGSNQCELRFFEDGDEALNYLKEKGRDPMEERPDLVILDLNIPRKDGRAVLSEMKQDESLKSIPVVVFSTSSSPVDIERSYQLGASAFLTKPADLYEFLDTIRSLEHFWLGSSASI